MTAPNRKTVIFADNRGGANDTDPPLSLAEDQCAAAINVDWWQGTFANKRGGSAATTTTFTGVVSALMRHVPGVDESGMEFFGVDGVPQIRRMAGGATWALPTIVDVVTGNAYDVTGLSFAGLFFLAYKSGQNRLHCWDSVISKIRRVGLAQPNPPTTASIGGGALGFTRSYRIRTYDSGGKLRRSEASTVVTQTVAASSGVRVTRPTLPTNENETSWEVEYAVLPAGPFYFAARIATGTTTYDDTAATIDTTTLTSVDGTNIAPPAAKYMVRDSGRVIMAGCFETTGGATVASDTRVWWTPPIGSTDVGDAERIPTGYSIDVESAITGLGGPVNGTVFVFGYRSIWALIPTSSTGAAAYQRITLRTDIGCIRHQSIVMAEDELGNPAVYFLSHKGPYRIGVSGVQYMGNDVEQLWATASLDAALVSCWGIYYAEKHQIWWGVAVSGETEPASARLMLDVRLVRYNQEKRLLSGGFAKHTGAATAARCACMFSATPGASMSRSLAPYIGQNSGNGLVWKCDTGTDDAGTAFQAYVDTRPVAPFGLGSNLGTTDPQLIANVSAGVTITVSPLSDFGLATTQAGTVSLAAAGSESRVQRRVEGLQAAGVGVIAFRVGDAAAVSNGWIIDALVAVVTEQEMRS